MRTVLSLFIIFLVQFSVSAQQKTTEELKELFNDAEFFFAQEAYADALYDYDELYNNGFNEIANINYKIGICYLNIPGEKEKSIDFLLEAVKDISKKYNESSIKQKSAPIDAYLFLGNAYRVNNKLSDAISAYTKYKELAGTSEEINYADQQIAACNTALRYMVNPKRIRMTNLGDSVNGTSSNYKGVVSGNGRVLLYMNELPFYHAVYFSKYTDHGWSAPVNITPQIQSDGDQFVTSVSYDGTQLILTREDAFNSDLYVSRFADGQWSRSVPLAGEDINTKYWESHASLSKDGKTLYFTSNRKDGSGDMDIYVSKVQPGGSWGKPVNLGPGINTALNEDTPFITENDSMLFFSSQGHENIGGYDIFVSRLDASGQWSKPENLGYPVSTTDDDLFYYPWNNDQVGFISRISDGGFGKEDLYALQPYDNDDLEDVLAEFFLVNEPATMELTSPAKTPVQDVPAEPKEPAEEPFPAAETLPAVPADTTEPSEPDKPLETTQPAEKIPPSPKEIELEPVYFAFDNFVLDEDGRKQLEKVHGYLTQYPVARIRLIGHADAKGPAEYNLKLSEKRAGTARDYLTQLGMDQSRVEIMGMGEKNFAAINSNTDGTDNPEGRRLNRRVEYELIGTDNTVIIIRMKPIPENLKYRK